MWQRTLSRSLVVVAALLLVASVLPAQDWAGKGRAHGQVSDENGNPVEGALITLLLNPNDPTSGPKPFETNKRGKWGYLGLDGGLWTVLIDADGYKPSQGTVTVNPFGTSPAAIVTLAFSANAAIDDGDALLESRDYAAARAKYLEAMRGLNEIGQARLSARVGDTYYEEGNYEAARGEYEKVLSVLDPSESGRIRVQIGNSYHVEGNYEAARRAFEQALPLLGPADREAILLNIAKGYDLSGDRAGAINALKTALEASPDSVSLIKLVADLLTREGQEEEARSYLAQLPEGTALPADMVLNIGIRLYNEGKTAEAKEYFDQAVEENADNATAYYYRGLTHLATGANDSARADFERLLELDPNSAHGTEVKEFLAFLGQGG